MHLRHIVPALGILASTTGAAFAENVGGLTVGGFVDTIFTYRDQNVSGESPRAIDRDFTAATELRIGYRATDKATAQVDLEWNNGDGTGRSEYLEQAFVNYAFAKDFSVTTGKFTTYAGWVSADADGLFRVNAGPIVALYGGELVGAALNYAPSEQLGVSVFLVNGLDVQEESSTNNNPNDRMGAGVDVVYKVKDIGSFNVEGGYDYLSSDDSEVSVGANATIKLASYKPLTLGAELLYRQLAQDSATPDLETTWLGALAMANHTIPGAPFQMSVTGMIQYVTLESETGGTTTIDNTTTELALALLTNPTGSSHFALNGEVAYQIFADDIPGTGGADVEDVKAATVSLEAIAVIP